MVDDVLPEAYSRMRSHLLKHAEAETVVDMQSVFLDFTSFVMGHMAYDVSRNTAAYDMIADIPRSILMLPILSPKPSIMPLIRLAAGFRTLCIPSQNSSLAQSSTTHWTR